MFKNDEWLSQGIEEVLDPDREIVDPHHHLWPPGDLEFSLEDLHSDTGSGHNIVETIFMECGAAYRAGGPEHLKCVGETEYVAEQALRSHDTADQANIAGIIARADLMSATLEEVLDAHENAGRGLFRGIRHAGAWDPDPEALTIPGQAIPGMLTRQDFCRGAELLGSRGLSYDTWVFHHQITEFAELAAAVPGTTMILDHFGTPLGVGAYEGLREEIFAKWKEDIAAVAAQPNTYAKLGGLAMPDNGFGWHSQNRPPSSDEFVQAQQRYYDHTIACFGPERCMFESNFPVDRLSLSYRTLWNGLKKIAVSYDEEAQELMFSGVARKVYRLD